MMKTTINGKTYKVRENSIAHKILKIKNALKPKNAEDVKMQYVLAGAMIMFAFLVIGEMGFRAMGM